MSLSQTSGKLAMLDCIWDLVPFLIFTALAKVIQQNRLFVYVYGARPGLKLCPNSEHLKPIISAILKVTKRWKLRWMAIRSLMKQYGEMLTSLKPFPSEQEGLIPQQCLLETFKKTAPIHTLGLFNSGYKCIVSVFTKTYFGAMVQTPQGVWPFWMKSANLCHLHMSYFNKLLLELFLKDFKMS